MWAWIDVGKVLKDEETISSYKIQNGHTIHMVKGAAKPSSSTPAGQASQPPRLPQMGTGLNVGSNPIDNVENIHHVRWINRLFSSNLTIINYTRGLRGSILLQAFKGSRT